MYVWGPPKCQAVSAPPGAPARCAGTVQTVWSSTVFTEPRKLGGASEPLLAPPPGLLYRWVPEGASTAGSGLALPRPGLER